MYTQNIKLERAMLASLDILKDDKDEESKIQICQMSQSNNKRTLMKVSNY